MLIRISITVYFFLLLASCAESRDRMAYIKQYEHIAIIEMERAGVPASIKMAQAILESGDGTSYLAREGNNHFGIKCGSKWTGKTVYLKDDDYKNGVLIKSCFRKYKDADESFSAHSDFLRNNQRYSQLFTYKKTDYRRWARGLKQAGYATSPTYAEKLIGIIERNNLHHLDNMHSPTPPLASIGKNGKPGNTGKPSKADKPGKQQTVAKSSTFVFNDVKMVKAGSNESYQAIAKRHKITLSKLLKYNDLKRKTALEKGDHVFLQPKRSSYRGKRQWHKVLNGETMHSISQRYGIKLSSLYKKNLMSGKQQPATGERIALRKKAKKSPKLSSVKRSTTKPKTVRPSTGNPHTPKPQIGKAPQKKIHLVQDSETLWSIAKRYGVTVDHLKTINGLHDSTIMKGQRLRIN